MEQFERFSVGRELATGDYSTVYEAEADGNRFALRVLKDEVLPPGVFERAALVQAIEGLRNIEHPSIVRVVDGGAGAGKVFVAMEFVDSPTLEQKLRELGRLGERQAVIFLRRAAQALDRARDQGYFHGNLTAANVFVISEEEIKVADFALRTLIDEPGAIAEASEGEPESAAEEESEWFSAEDLLKEKEKKATTKKLDDDLVGLGVLLMRMLGVDVPAQEPDEALAQYRKRLRTGPCEELTTGAVSAPTVDVLRLLLSPKGFGSPGEVVVELAGAMMSRRTADRVEAGPAAAVPPAGAPLPTAAAEEAFQFEAPASAQNLTALEFAGDPRTAAFTPFFVWRSRRHGNFFVVFEGQRITLGRDPDSADVVLADPNVSRQHCALTRAGSTLLVEDLGSRNGTFINEQKVQKAELQPSDTLRVGTVRVYMTMTLQG